jgi:hypothetical protein
MLVTLNRLEKCRQSERLSCLERWHYRMEQPQEFLRELLVGLEVHISHTP